MITKDKMLKAVDGLPDVASVEDAMERLLVLAKIERGLLQADHDETLSHQAVKQRLGKWVT